ncbi:MAG: Ig-like domain-containing protein [Eubacteriales bacterium]
MKKLMRRLNKNGLRLLIFLQCFVLVIQMMGLRNIVFGASPYYFRGYDIENITSSTFMFSSGTSAIGSDIVMTDSDVGEAIGFIALDESGHDISTSVDLGKLEIDFSTTSHVTEEGEKGLENDIPTVRIDFCETNYSTIISTEYLHKEDNTVAGDEVISSAISIPQGTRSIIVYLHGENISDSNTVHFSNVSFMIHDEAEPTCNVTYDTGWTNTPFDVTITASDNDSGLEGIYINDAKVSSTSPYHFQVSDNSEFVAYSKDYAGKTSNIREINITNIDVDIPTAPSALTLSHDNWTNTDVNVMMPDLGVSTGAPERYVYRLDGGTWMDLPTDFFVSDSGAFDIDVAIADATGNISEVLSDIIYIDKFEPVINSVSQSVSSGSCVVTVDAFDQGLSGISMFKYAKGSVDAAYFIKGGTDIEDGTFTVLSGGTFTLYMADIAGNHVLREYDINTAPSMIDFVDTTMDEDETLRLLLNVTDEETPIGALDVSASASDTTLIPTLSIDRTDTEIYVEITPGSDLFGGPVTIHLNVTDAHGETASDSFNLTVLSINDDPIAVDDTEIFTNEDESVRIDVLSNDADPADEDPLTIISSGLPTHGTTNIVAGKIRYMPEPNFNGEDSFVYTISDGNGGTATATAYVKVIEVNGEPEAIADTITATEDTSILIDVLANDMDADLTTTDDEVLTLISVTEGLYGSASIENGKIRYTPDENWFGSDTFIYTIEDREGLSSAAEVKVKVTPVSDPPVFEDLQDSYTIDEDSEDASITFSIKDVETPANSLMLQGVSSDETLLRQEDIKIEGLGDSLDTMAIKVTPVANKHGSMNIRLTLGDGFETVIETVALNIMPVNDIPMAINDVVYYDEGQERITIDMDTLMENDTDIDKDALIFAGIASDPLVGTLEPIEGSTYYYYPESGYIGEDSFTYLVSDGTATVTGTCYVRTNAMNDAPVITISESEYEMDEDTTRTDIIFHINDRETEVEDLIVTAWSNDSGLIVSGGVVVVNNDDGTCSISITSVPDAFGTATIQVSVSDGILATTDRFLININAVADAPVAVNDSIYVPISGSQTFNVLSNDRDADGDTLFVASYDDSGLNGTLTYNADTKIFTYISSAGESGISFFTYSVSDGDHTTSNTTATVALDVRDAGYSPVLSSIADQHIYEDANTGDISFNVTDEDVGETFTIDVTSSNIVLLPENFEENIIVTDNGSGIYAIRLVPAADAFGITDVTVTVTDSTENVDNVTFCLNVLPINDAPVAVNDLCTVEEDQSIELDLLTNDSDPEGDTIWINYMDEPVNGTLTKNGSTITYAPHANWNGIEVLTYHITDGMETASATITINVTSINDAPVAYSNWLEISNEEGSSATSNVLSNDYDQDGDTVFMYEIVSQGTYGTAVINPDGSITYTRDKVSPNSNGSDYIIYRIMDRESADGDCLFANGYLYIGVEFYSVLNCDVKVSSCDEDAVPYEISLPISNPNHVEYELNLGETSLGTFTQIGPTRVLFTPARDAFGYDAIPYSVTEVGGGENATSTILLTVYPVNDAPNIDSTPDNISCEEDSVGTSFDIAFHDVDNADNELILYAYTTNVQSHASATLSVDITVEKSAGLATITAHPSIANGNGSLDIVLGVSDGIAATEHTVTMTVNAVDDAPVLSPISRTLYEDKSVTFSVVTPRSDVDGDVQIAFIPDEDGPAKGTAVINDDGTITYTPNKDWYGIDTLVFSVSDLTEPGLTSTHTATMMVLSVNDAPEITNLAYYQTTMEDTSKNVLLNVKDTDDDLSDASCYTFTSGDEDVLPSENITISHISENEMMLTLVPGENAYGNTIVGISASDGELSAQGAFQLTVEPVNDLPVAADDHAIVTERVGRPVGTTSVTINLTDNDIDVDDTTLQVTEVKEISIGNVVNHRNGTVTYSVEGDFNGMATFTYTVMDSQGATDTANVTVTVNPANDPPTAVNDFVTISEDEQITIPALQNDGDIEEDPLTLIEISECNFGTAVISGSNIIYTPTLDYSGEDSFTYTVSDGQEGISTASIYITIKPDNDPPTVEKHSSMSGEWVMEEDSSEPFHFTVYDAETPMNNLIITITSLDTAKLKTAGISLSSAETYRVLTVTPEKDAYGLLPVRIEVTDGARTTQKDFDIIIKPVNDPPVINTPATSTLEDTLVNSTVTATDIDSDSWIFHKVTDPANGSVMVDEEGTYIYTPNLNFSGSDSFTISVDDGASENNISTGTVHITVQPVNDEPIAVEDNVNTPEDTPIIIDVLDNDMDVDIAYGDIPVIISFSSPTNGSVNKVGNSLQYTPNENWNGIDTFTYTIQDSEDKQSSADVTVTVTSVNDAPSGDDNTAQTDEDTSITIDVITNHDVDLLTNSEDETLTVVSVDSSLNGATEITEDEKHITYTPSPNWNGIDVFNYTLQDKEGLEEIFTVTVTVNPVNDDPELSPVLTDITIDEDTSTSAITVNVRDEEDDDNTLSTIVSHNNDILLSEITVPDCVDGTRSFTILPELNENGRALVTVIVTDSKGATATDTFTLTVNPVNDPPVAQDDEISTDENTPVNIDVLDNDDVDLYKEGDTLTITSVDTVPSYGSVEIITVDERQMLAYIPDNSRSFKENNVEVLRYTMRDISGLTSSAYVTINVTPVNDAPRISSIDDMEGIPEDASQGTGVLAFTVRDEEDEDSTLDIKVECSNTTLFPLDKITVLSLEGGDGSGRTVQVIPAENMFGEATITLTVKDVEGLTATESFNVTVTSVDDTPQDGNDAFDVSEDERTQLNVLMNDDVDYLTEPEQFTITAITALPSHGTVEIAPDFKTLYYTTNENSNETDAFTYQMYDATGGVYHEFVVDITVMPVNDAPVVTLLGENTYTVNEGIPQMGIPFTVTDVDNNTDASSGDALEVSLTAVSSNPILLVGGLHINTLHGDNRSIDVIPYNKWNGQSTITITGTDSDGEKGTATFTFIVNNVNEAPVANDDVFTVAEDALSFLDVLVNDTDEDFLTNSDTEYLKVSSITNENPNAQITITEDSKGVNIQPLSNYNGTISFSYIVEDSEGEISTASVTVIVSQINDIPVAVEDTATADEDTGVMIDVLVNDSDIDLDESLNTDPQEELSISIGDTELSTPLHGTIQVVDEEIWYTPNAHYNGIDTFEYNAYDGQEKHKALVTVNVMQVNDSPIAVSDTATTNEDETVTIDVLANDTDVDTNATLNQGELHQSSSFSITEAGINDPAHGIVEIIEKKIVYTPEANWQGIDTISYTLSDGYGSTATGIATVTVVSINDLPEFFTEPVDMHLIEDGANGESTFSVTDVETEDSLLSITVVNSSNTDLMDMDDVMIMAGTEGTRTVIVNPKDDQNGTGIITLRITDTDGGTADFNFTVTVNGVNDAPVAENITENISEDTNFSIPWAELVSDVDIPLNGDNLNVTIEEGDGGEHGTAEINGLDIIYIPQANRNGIDSFTYTVTDTEGETDKGIVTIIVTQVNDAPVSVEDNALTDEDTPITIDVLANDWDIDMDKTLNTPLDDVELTISIGDTGLTMPSHGTIEVVDGQIKYTPNTHFNGMDSFEYNAYDGKEKHKAMVTVTILQINDDPVAVDDSAGTLEATTVTINVLSNDSDVDTDSDLNKHELHAIDDLSVISYTIEGDDAHGSLSASDTGFSYTPEYGYLGTLNITYTLSDGHGGSATGTLHILINNVNDPPVAVQDTIITDEDTPVSVNLLDNDNDPDKSDSISFVMFTEDVSGLPGIINTTEEGFVTFTPNTDYNGSFSIDYQMRDLDGLTDTATLTIVVEPVDDIPSADDDNITMLEDTVSIIDVGILIRDPDVGTNDDSLTISVAPEHRPSHGSVSVRGTNITYNSESNYNGEDRFTYTVTDSSELTDTGIIHIVVTPINDTPVAIDDNVSTNEDTPMNISVLSNDMDVDMDEVLNESPQGEEMSLYIGDTGLITPLHGSIAVVDEQICYTPSANFNGTDRFEYILDDGEEQSNAMVRVTISQVNDVPVATDDTETTEDEEAVIIDVLANDTDIDTNASLNTDTLHNFGDFRITNVTTPHNGKAVITRNKIKYTPRDTFSGMDNFSYTMTDGYGGTATANVIMTVMSANDPPAIPVVYTPIEGTRYGGASVIDITWSGYDIDGDTLTYTLAYFDGSIWNTIKTEIHETNYQFTLPETMQSLTDMQFRVNAFDGEYTSGYGYSGKVMVDKDVPKNIVVSMKTEDDRMYTTGTWTNQSVIVKAVSVEDASPVTFAYALEDKFYNRMTKKIVTEGIHHVFIKATDAFENIDEFGGYLVKVDKQAPAVPNTSISLSGTKAVIRFAFKEDPGGSGNNKLVPGKNTALNAVGSNLTWAVSANGKYSFVLYDNAGNSTQFSVRVDILDETPPAIHCDSGNYVIGKGTVNHITARLEYTENESGIIAKGYRVTQSDTFSGVYSSYEKEIEMTVPGTYYIHAFAQNALGLNVYKTFGPFIIETPVIEDIGEEIVKPSETNPPVVSGDVIVSAGDVLKNAVKIRLPGGEWSDVLVLKDIEPGVYLVEVFDQSGKTVVVEITITDESIAKGVYVTSSSRIPWWHIGVAGTGLLLLLLLLACNVKVYMFTDSDEKILRTLRRFKKSTDTLTLKLKPGQIQGSTYGKVELSKGLTKHMKGKNLVIMLKKQILIDIIVPQDVDGRFSVIVQGWLINNNTF